MVQETQEELGLIAVSLIYAMFQLFSYAGTEPNTIRKFDTISFAKVHFINISTISVL